MRKANIAADIKRAQTLAEDMLENNVETDDENFYADVEFEDIPMGEVPDRFDEEACEEKDKKALVKSWTKHMLQVSKQRSEAEEPAADFLRQRELNYVPRRRGKRLLGFSNSSRKMSTMLTTLILVRNGCAKRCKSKLARRISRR